MSDPIKTVTYIVAGEEAESFEAAQFAWRILRKDGRRKGLTITEKTTVLRDVTPQEPAAEPMGPAEEEI
jgi:hypothetical protein